MYPNKQPNSSDEIEQDWAASLVAERVVWRLYWYFNAPGVVSTNRPIREREKN